MDLAYLFSKTKAGAAESFAVLLMAGVVVVVEVMMVDMVVLNVSESYLSDLKSWFYSSPAIKRKKIMSWKDRTEWNTQPTWVATGHMVICACAIEVNT